MTGLNQIAAVFLSVGLISAFYCPVPASAQEATSAEESAEAAGERREIEEIVVTARRREESLQAVPLSVTLFDEDALEAMAIDRIEDLGVNTPSLSLEPGEFRRHVLNATQRGITGAAGNIHRDSSTGFYFNEVIFMRTHGSNGTMYDMANVQVLNGPQGTLFGRNTMGGAILFTHRRPEMDSLAGKLQVDIGNLGRLDTHVMGNFPLAENLAIRVNYKTSKFDGGIEIVGQNDRKGYDEDATSWRFSLLWEPNEDLSTYFIYSGFREENHGTPQYRLASPTNTFGQAHPNAAFDDYRGDIPREIADLSAPLESDVDTWDLTNITELKVSENVTLKNIAAYRNVEAWDIADFDGTDVDIFPGAQSGQLEDTWQFSEEIQLQGSSFDGALDWSTGLYFIREDGTEYSTQHIFGSNLIVGGDAEHEHFSVYGQGTLDLSRMLEGLSFTGGYRMNYDDKEFDLIGYDIVSWALPFDKTFRPSQTDPVGLDELGCNIVDKSIVIGGTPGDEIFAPISDNVAGCVLPQSDDWSEPTWTLGFDYQVTDDVMAYVVHRRGYRSGRLSRRATAPQEALPVDPEFLTDYEIGLKASWELFGVPLRTNLAVFYSEFEDIHQAISIPLGVGGVVQSISINGGEDEIRGVEAQVTVQPTDNLTIDAWYSWNKGINETIFIPDPTGGVGFTTKSLDEEFRAPKYRAGATVTYVLPLSPDWGELALVGNASWIDDDPGGAHADTEFTKTVLEQNRLGIYNARLEWRNILGREIDLTLWGRNLSNETYGSVSDVFANAAGGALAMPLIIFRDPRTYGVTIKYRF